MKYIIGSFAVVLTVIACSPKVTEVITEVEEVEMSADMTEGRAIYDSSCIKCHGLKKIEDFSKAQWEKILPGMMEKAKLSEDQKMKVHAYVFGSINE